MYPPEVQYAKSGDVHIAFQTFGNEPLDLIVGMPWVTHLVVGWEDAPNAQFFRDLSSFARLILFDKRGVGLSDRDVGIPTLEERMDDFRAVMDAVGSKKAVLMGISESAPMSIVFAASHPERTLGLILVGGGARSLRAPDYPWGPTLEEKKAEIRRVEREWGTPSFVDHVVEMLAPSRAHDTAFKQWFGRELSFGASPSSIVALEKMNLDIDVRSVLPAIHVPTLVLAGDAQDDIAEGKYMASNIPGAKFAEIPVREHLYYATPAATTAVVRSVREFVKGLSETSDTERVLTTVLFTDIVASTRHLSAVGDLAWTRILAQYHEKVRMELDRFRGRLIKTTGDGMLAIFDGPTRAVRCACVLRDRAREVGLEIRAGLHSGECVLREDDVQGIAVHIAARVSERAGDGQVLVSGTVRDLSVGSEIRFKNQGAHTLRGVEGEWRTYSVETS
jgi:class 3 adenylate cyclase